MVVIERDEQPEIAAVYANPRSTEPTPPAWLCIECTGTGVVRVATNVEVLLEFARGTERVLGGMSFDKFAASGILSASLRVDDAAHALDVSHLFLSIAGTIERGGSGGALWILPAISPHGRPLGELGHRVTMSPTWAAPFREEWEMRTSTIRLLNPPVASPPHMEEIQWMAQEWDRGRKAAVSAYLADLARVDGAILVNATPDVLAFGVVCNKFEHPARRVVMPTEPSRPLAEGSEVGPAHFGGSRHRSAIDFCSSFAPAAAIVASHDGGITVFASKEPGEVVGTRISSISSTDRPPPP